MAFCKDQFNCQLLLYALQSAENASVYKAFSRDAGSQATYLINGRYKAGKELSIDTKIVKIGRLEPGLKWVQRSLKL